MSYNKITKDKFDHLLFELAKEYHRLGKRKVKGEIIIVGGASVISNYDFRDMSEDADAIINAQSFLKEAIYKVAKDNNLPDNWLNEDFVHTTSYSKKLEKYSKPYKTFANSFYVKTIDREYLIAMKLVSFRQYKNDKSDIIGILVSEYNKQNKITLEQVKQAIINLYGDYNYISNEATEFIEGVLENDSYLELYNKIRNEEKVNRKIVMENTNIIKNGNDISYIIFATKNKELNKLYEELGVSLSNNININAKTAQSLIEKACKEKNTDINTFLKNYFGDLFDLHLEYLNKR